MFCRFCGANIGESPKNYCAFCGANLNVRQKQLSVPVSKTNIRGKPSDSRILDNMTQIPKVTRERSQSVQVLSKAKRRRRKTICLSLITLFIILILSAVIFDVISIRKKTSNTPGVSGQFSVEQAKVVRDQFYEHVNVSIDEESISDGSGQVVISFSDLTEILDAFLVEGSKMTDDEFIHFVTQKMKENIRYVQIETELVEYGGDWVVADGAVVQGIIGQKLDEALIHILLTLRES